MILFNSYDQNVSFTDVRSFMKFHSYITPEITDELANLIPEIYNIELLNVETFDDTFVNSNKY